MQTQFHDKTTAITTTTSSTQNLADFGEPTFFDPLITPTFEWGRLFPIIACGKIQRLGYDYNYILRPKNPVPRQNDGKKNNNNNNNDKKNNADPGPGSYQGAGTGSVFQSMGGSVYAPPHTPPHRGPNRGIRQRKNKISKRRQQEQRAELSK